MAEGMTIVMDQSFSYWGDDWRRLCSIVSFETGTLIKPWMILSRMSVLTALTLYFDDDGPDLLRLFILL